MQEMLEEIDSWIRHIWLKVVKKEYERGRILEESNLHSTVYFHLRKLMESSKNKKTKPFIYSEMPFSTTMRGEGKKNPRVDPAGRAGVGPNQQFELMGESYKNGYEKRA